MKLQTVEVTRADSGLSYALKRIGFSYDSHETINTQWLIDKIRRGIFVEVNEHKDALESGDIVLLEFEYSEDYDPLPTVIDSSGLIISPPVHRKLYIVSVYEKNDIVSSLSASENRATRHPFIEAHRLTDYRVCRFKVATFVRTFAIRLKDKSYLQDKKPSYLQSLWDEVLTDYNLLNNKESK